MTKVQGYVLIGLVVLGLGASLAPRIGPAPKWEYKVVAIGTEGLDRVDKGAALPHTIQIGADSLREYGDQGWELVGSFLEMETAFPNFGRGEYVTGLQPNVRPQRLVLIFKRPLGVRAGKVETEKNG